MHKNKIVKPEYTKYDTVKINGKNRILYIKSNSKSKNPITYVKYNKDFITYKQFLKFKKMKKIKKIKGGVEYEVIDVTNVNKQKLIEMIKSYLIQEKTCILHINVSCIDNYNNKLERGIQITIMNYSINSLENMIPDDYHAYFLDNTLNPDNLRDIKLLNVKLQVEINPDDMVEDFDEYYNRELSDTLKD